MKRNAIKGSEPPLSDETSSNRDHHTDYAPTRTPDKEDALYDDGEHFEFELFKIFKIKSKRVTGNVITVIALLLLAILVAIILKR